MLTAFAKVIAGLFGIGVSAYAAVEATAFTLKSVNGLTGELRKPDESAVPRTSAAGG